MLSKSDIIERVLALSRGATLEQLAVFFNGHRSNTSQFLKDMIAAGDVRIATWYAALPPVPLSEPLCVIPPGHELPDLGEAASRGRRRHTPKTQIDVYVARAQLRTRWGAPARIRKARRSQLGHDLGVAGCLIAKAVSDDFELWVSEDEVPDPSYLIPKPDAFIRTPPTPTGRLLKVIEYTGTSYRRERLERIADEYLSHHHDPTPVIEIW